MTSSVLGIYSVSDPFTQMKWEKGPDPGNTIFFIQVVKYEYQTWWGFDGILIKAKIQSWLATGNKEKKE